MTEQLKGFPSVSFKYRTANRKHGGPGQPSVAVHLQKTAPSDLVGIHI